MKILEEILDEHKNSEFIDIYQIISDFWINIIEKSLEKGNEILWVRACCDWVQFIFVRENLNEKEKRFVLAHELCHFLLNEKWLNMWILKVKSEIEKRADNFACDLLLPEKPLKEAYETFENIPTISDMFWVPEKVVEYKLNKIYTKNNFNF